MGTLKKLMEINIMMKAKTHWKSNINKYAELWNKIRGSIKSVIDHCIIINYINNNSDNYNEKYMKIQLNSNDDLTEEKN